MVYEKRAGSVPKRWSNCPVVLSAKDISGNRFHYWKCEVRGLSLFRPLLPVCEVRLFASVSEPWRLEKKHD